MKCFLTIVAVLVLIGGIIVGFFDHPGVMTIAFLGSISLLMTANLDRIAGFKASGFFVP